MERDDAGIGRIHGVTYRAFAAAANATTGQVPVAAPARTAEAIELGAPACVEANSLDTTATDETDPVPRGAFFLVEYEEAGSRSGYGTVSAPLPRVATSGDCPDEFNPGREEPGAVTGASGGIGHVEPEDRNAGLFDSKTDPTIFCCAWANRSQ